jgi:4-hydroxybenzoate polyprenyltransferase
MKKLKLIYDLLRCKQYAKNLFIFIPLYFGGKLFDLNVLISTFKAFFLFSFLASSIYIINDLIDIKEDQQHPKKKYRPIPSGEITKPVAFIISIIIAVLVFSYAFLHSINLVLIFITYYIANIFYCLKLKHIAIVDVFIIGFGFVIRLIIGSFVADAPLSSWITIMVFMLSLFLGFAKRRDDVLIYVNQGKKMRKSIDGYNLQLIDLLMSMMGAIIIVAYIMYTISIEAIQQMNTDKLYYTSIFVILSIFRYFQLTIVSNKSGSPTEILYKDRVIEISVLLWGLLYGYFIYL